MFALDEADIEQFQYLFTWETMQVFKQEKIPPAPVQLQ